METLRADLRSEMADLSASIYRWLRAQTWVMTSTMVASVGLAATLAAALTH